MAAPVVEGITYPAHVHVEYPKVVYEGGDLKGSTRTVANEAEEAEALEAGFAAYAAPEPAPLAGDDGDDTLGAATEPEPVTADVVAAPEPVIEPTPPTPARRGGRN